MLAVFLLLITLATSLLCWNPSPPLRYASSVTTEHILAHAKTGDILYFRSQRRPFIYLLAVPLTHIGIIVVHEGRKYVIEMHQKGDAPPGYNPKADGPHTYPLKSRLNEFKGPNPRWLLYWCPTLTQPREADVSWAFPPRYIPYNYDYQKQELVCRMFPWTRPERGEIMDSMHCANYAVYVLKKLGIVPATASMDCKTPPEVRNLGKFGPILKIAK